MGQDWPLLVIRFNNVICKTSHKKHLPLIFVEVETGLIWPQFKSVWLPLKTLAIWHQSAHSKLHNSTPHSGSRYDNYVGVEPCMMYAHTTQINVINAAIGLPKKYYNTVSFTYFDSKSCLFISPICIWIFLTYFTLQKILAGVCAHHSLSTTGLERCRQLVKHELLVCTFEPNQKNFVVQILVS